MERVLKISMWCAALIAEIEAVMFTMVFLIVVDFITGVYAAYKNGKQIRSKKIGNTISKFLIYNMVVISAFLLEKYIVQEIPWMKIIAAFIAITELKSILENFDKIYGVNPFKALVNFIKRKDFMESFDNTFNDNKDETTHTD